MIINSKEIIERSKEIFLSDKIQADRYYNSKSVSVKDYDSLHTSFLTPLDITFDPKSVEGYINSYRMWFQRWGNTTQERYGIALVNKDGKLRKTDPVNMSLQEWNQNNPDNVLMEMDCVKPTELMNGICFNSLKVFDKHWCRSNILIWKNDAHFLPHIDAIKPTPWLRLWGCTNNNVELRYAVNDELVKVKNIEPGRLYLIDTTRVHDARNLSDTSMQLFLSVLPSAYNIIKSSLL
jgi:hypothetical protein